MTFESLLTNKLQEITELNGNVYPLCVPESIPPPYICYVQSGGSYNKDLQGYNDLKEADYEINILATKYSQLKPLEAKVFTALKALVGEMADNKVIQDIEIFEASEQYEEQIKLQRANIEFTVFY